ncbi:MAG: hypothetical protein ACK2TV_07870, partial [Anaerolineales bacterium]
LKDYDGFYPLYEVESGLPVGDRNAVSALLPLRTFLQLAGIRLLTPHKIAVWGINPFPWPINIRWQGLSIRKTGSKTEVTFPNGAMYEGDSQESILISSGISDS